jgi:protease-4
LRAAIATFRASKKPVHAHLVNPDTRDYYLASAASNVTLDPFGALLLPGMSAEAVFFAGLLEKYGIGVQVSRVGRFKAAVEPFTRTDMSPESRLQTRMYLNEMWSEVKRGIAESRGVDTTALQNMVDAQGIILPADALSAKLVDRVAYFDEVLTDLETAAGVQKKVAAASADTIGGRGQQQGREEGREQGFLGEVGRPRGCRRGDDW